MTPESRNSGVSARRPLMNNDLVNTKFPLQRLTKTCFRGNEYSGVCQWVARILSHVFMAAENNRENLQFYLVIYIRSASN
jgi:hypothetical protein